MNPTLTIGLAVYNGAEFLHETIESILRQTYTDFELIISDNASTDRTEGICRAFAESDDRVRYIRQSENIGACANFNFLFTEAHGKYFKWAAADDVLAPEYLARCVDVLDRHKEFVLCHTQTVTIDSAGRELPNDIIRSSGAVENPELKRPGFEHAWRRFRGVLLGNGNPVYDTSTTDFYGVSRTSDLARTNLLEPYIGYEKVLLAMLALQGRICEVPLPLFSYRLHPKSASNQTSASALQNWSDPNRVARRYPRLQYLRGYLSGIFRMKLSYRERLMCLLVIGQYLLQVRKWKRVVLASMFGRGIGDGNVEILRQNEVDVGHYPDKNEPISHG